MINLDSAETARTVLRAFFNIAREWQLGSHEQASLLAVTESACDQWRRGKVNDPVSSETMERLSYILDIYASLHALLTSPERANAWVHQPNTTPLFGGEPALMALVGGGAPALKAVADYLRAVRQGG